MQGRGCLVGGGSGSGMFDNVVCFSLRVGEICNLPTPRKEIMCNLL
jgi:hypothetical protein